ISRTSRPLESVIYREQQLRDEQERQAQELALRWHEELEPEARIWRGPSMGM
ncbi:mobilization protein, partial [Salmonella enterica subsp. enterica serovar Corvallis]|nr:mobilization protein [Salmonella enterica subsp. enterica serovar Corvallis]